MRSSAQLAASGSTSNGSRAGTNGSGVGVSKSTLFSASLSPRSAAGEDHGAKIASRQVGSNAEGRGVEAEGHELGGGLKSKHGDERWVVEWRVL